MVEIRKQNRLVKFDYSQPGYYFVTICTFHKLESFGKVENKTIVLNGCGRIANDIWIRAPSIYQDVKLDEFIVMPNHMHGIVVIEPRRQATGLRYSLSQIIGFYKNVVTKSIHAIGITEFNRQPSYYDHVIRKDESLDKIREYIRNNPLKWDLDRNNLSNLWM